MSVAIGQKAPSFSLLNQHGDSVSLASFENNKKVVLYFYPRASTPGCTVQACGMRDSQAELQKLGVEVLAVSPDPVPKIAKFAEKQDVNFNLLSDEDHAVAELYGVWGLKKFMGRESMGIIRSTFIIDESGMLLAKLPKFTTKNHHEVVIDCLKNSDK